MYPIKKTKNLSGFTLVELIVTITIVAILGTIGLVSIQNFYGSSRDSVRITDLKSIQQGLIVFQVKSGLYPLPENPLEIKADDTTILSYQGYVSDTLSSLIKINKNPLDPKDTTRYTYTVSKDQKKAQLMGYLESGDTLKITSYTDVTKYLTNHIFNPVNTLTHIISQSYAADTNTVDYTDRFVYVTGDTIGVLTDENNAPLQESTTATGINLSTEDTTGYTAYFGGDTYGDGTSTGTGDVLITQILGVITNTIPCNPTTYSGYTITALSHDETNTFTKPITVINGTGTGSLQVQCLNGTLDTEHATETINVGCDDTFVNTGDNICVLNECGGSVPIHAEMLIGTTQSILQNWIRSTTAGVCTFDCKTNYTYNIGANTCDANTQQAIACNGSIKPYSTDNSTTTTWTQTWNETQWLPVYTYTQNTTPNICTFVCNTGYTWDSVNEVCAVNIYTVTFNSNGGTTVSSINANYNTTITAPTPPTKTGYTFAGWYKDAGLTTAWNFTTDTVTVATTLYAKWIITTFTLSSSSVTSGTPITISHNCITPPTSYTSSNTAVATISATTITSLAAGTTNITPIGGNCNDSVTKVLVVTAPQYPGCSIPDIPVGGKYWAACNVGASQPSTAYVASANDSTIGTETTNGKYFQWGENVAWDYDGGVTSTDNCTWNRDTQACGASALGAWSATVSDVTSGGVDRWNDWSTTDTRGPCAPNYHVPTQTEWNIVYTTLGSTRNTLASTLKLPMAGSRYYTDGSLVVQSFYASYWSSSPDTTNAYYLDFTTTAAYLDFSYGRARSFSVRCLKN